MGHKPMVREMVPELRLDERRNTLQNQGYTVEVLDLDIIVIGDLRTVDI